MSLGQWKMTVSTQIAQLLGLIYGYEQLGLMGRSFVRAVDEIVASAEGLTLPEECQKDFDQLHVKLALCVWDEQTYREAPTAYICESEMRAVVREFVSKWGNTLASMI